jgi:hypothetical protein
MGTLIEPAADQEHRGAVVDKAFQNLDQGAERNPVAYGAPPRRPAPGRARDRRQAGAEDGARERSEGQVLQYDI